VSSGVPKNAVIKRLAQDTAMHALGLELLVAVQDHSEETVSKALVHSWPVSLELRRSATIALVQQLHAVPHGSVQVQRDLYALTDRARHEVEL
jgi:hypothetical protein